MQKKDNVRLYAIVDASDTAAVATLKAVLTPYSPKYRDGKTVVIGGVEHVLFVEFRKREGPMFDIMKSLADRYKLYPFYVIEEDKDLQPKSDKYGNDCKYFVVDAAVMDFPAPAEGFGTWQEKFRAVAKEIYRDDSVFLKVHAYYRRENGTIHAIIGNTENTKRQAPEDKVKLGEKGWRDAVCKMAEALGIEPKFKKVRYKNL